MGSKISLKWAVIILGTVAIVSFLAIIFFLIFYSPGRVFNARPVLGNSNHASNAFASPGSGLPMHLTIPEIGVDAAIEYLGLASSGAMAVPEGPVDVAWFDIGPRPGEVGSAVIAGHEGWKDGIAAAFDNLHKLQKGDKVYVEDEAGAVTTFVVREVGTYDENGNAAAVFSSNDGKAHLNLITCEGIWNAATQSYSNRLVVFTDKE